MGLALTLTYIVLTIIPPDQFGPAWTSYHPMAYLAGITAVASLPNMLAHMQGRFVVQTRLLFGFLCAIALSQLVSGRLRGAIESWQAIIPSAAIFFFTVANVTTVRRLKIIIWITIAACLSVVVEALCGYYVGFRGDLFVLLVNGQPTRLRGAGFFNDPNDLAQILLIALPLIFIGWNRGRTISNLFIVLTPTAFLLWAVYLTHSRGALIALGVLVLMTAQKRIGKSASLLLAGIFIFGMIALDFTGGRGISAGDGVDRLELWAEGLQLFKSAPLFGVGFGRFTDFFDHTAHNSFVLCLAELGLVGSTMWVALLVTAMIDLKRVMDLQEQLPDEAASAAELVREEQSIHLDLEPPSTAAMAENSDGEIEPMDTSGLMLPAFGGEVVYGSGHTPNTTLSEWSPVSCEPAPIVMTVSYDEAKVATDEGYLVPKLFGFVMCLALISFVTTSFFLSRSYSPTMYLVLGLVTATIAIDRPIVKLDPRRWVLPTLVAETLTIVFIYCVVRLRH